MTDLAKLAIVVESGQVVKASKDLDKMTASGNRAEKSTKRLSKAAQQSQKSIAGMISPLKVVGGLLAGVSSIRLFSGMARTIADFEQSMSNVSAVSGAVGASLEQLTAQAKELGSTTRFSASEAAAGMEFLARAGFKTVEIMSALPDVLNLAAAGALGLGEAADISSNIMSGFNIEAEEMSRVADVLALTAASANTNVQQLGEGMKFAAPVARAFGQTLEDTAALMGALGNAGIQAGMAGTNLRQIMLALANPTSKAASTLNKYGITLDQVNPATNRLVDILKLLGEKITEPAETMKIFSSRTAGAVLAIQSMIPTVDELGESLLDASGTAQVMADTMQDNLGGAIITMKSAAEGLVLAFGDSGFAGALRTSVDSLTVVLRTMTKHMDDLVDAATVLAIAFGTKLAASLVLMAGRFATVTVAMTQNALAARGVAAENLVAAKSHAAVTAAALADAKAHQAATVQLGIYGPARAAANVQVASATALHGSATAAVTAQTAAMARMTLGARAAAGAMGLLSASMAFLGGPVGVAIAAVAAAIFLVSRASREATDAQDKYKAALAAGNVVLKTAAERQEALATSADEASLALLQQTHVLQTTRLATIKLESAGANTARAALGSRVQIQFLTEAIQDSEEAMGNLITKLSGTPRKLKDVGKAAEDAAGNIAEICSAAKEVGTCAERLMKKLKKENDELQNLATATAKGEKALKELAVQKKVNEALSQAGAKATKEQREEIEEAVRVNEAYKESIDNTVTAQEEAIKVADDRAAAEQRAVDATTRLMQQPFLNAIDGIQSATTTMFKNILDGGVDSFSDLGDSILNIFKQTLAEMATLAIARPIIIPTVTSIGGMMGVPCVDGIGGSASSAGSFLNAGGSALGLLQGGGLSPLGAAGLFAGGGALIGANTFGGSTASTIGGGIGGAAGGFGAILAASGSAGIGTALGATFGSAFPVIGTIVGGILGSAIGSLFSGGKDKMKIASRTTVSGSGTETPFGFVDVTGKNLSGGANKIEEAFVDIDKAFANFLTEGEIEDVAKRLQSDPFALKIGTKFSGGEQFRIFEDRISDIFSGLGLSDSFNELTSGMKRSKDNIEKLIEVTNAFLAQRDAIRDAVTAFSEVTEPLSQVEAAVQAIQDQVDELSAAARDANFASLIPMIESAQALALTQMRRDFDTSISSTIMGITDPIESVFTNLEKAQQQRLDDAILLGADLVKVEELNALEREAVLKEIFQSTFDDIVNEANAMQAAMESAVGNLSDFVGGLALSSTSPLTPTERLDTAQDMFDEVLAAAQGGDVGAIGGLPDAAQQLIGEAASFFAGTEGFQDIFRDVNSSLNDIIELNDFDPVVNAIDSTGEQSVENTALIIDAIDVVSNGNEELKDTLDDFVELLTRLLSEQQAA